MLDNSIRKIIKTLPENMCLSMQLIKQIFITANCKPNSTPQLRAPISSSKIISRGLSSCILQLELPLFCDKPETAACRCCIGKFGKIHKKTHVMLRISAMVFSCSGQMLPFRQGSFVKCYPQINTKGIVVNFHF